MRRRHFLGALGVTALWASSARAQMTMPVIGYVTGSLKLSEWFLAGVREGLAELGYVEGKNYRFEFRDTNLQGDRFPIAVRELVDQRVSLILSPQTSVTQAAQAATQTIPVVFFIGSDPIENGFVKSLKEPGSNLTGVFNLHSRTTGKRLEFLRELVPFATKFAFLSGPGELLSKNETREALASAHSLGLELTTVRARKPDEIDAAFDTSLREGARGIVIGSDGLFVDPTQTVALMMRHGMPTISIWDRFVRSGGLISYATDEVANYRLVGSYVGRILNGQKPADIPVQQATKTKLVINLKTAKAMAITFPISLLGRADEVIE
jgi:ABC-type uncharacterized transport system substrate-binding protein